MSGEKSQPVVGRYREFEILEEIGAGGFARVYKVRAPGHRAPLALKLATNMRMSEDMIKRGIREVAVLRSLTNPHVAHLHGSSIGSDHFYVLMDYLEGQQLDEFHRWNDAMGAAQALDLVLQACMGLAEAHAQGVVHRDIKPANIWVSADGTVKVLDFGLARAWGVPWAYGTDATAARTVVGTPHYCQPEQLHSDTLTPASDVYSLATILYEMLSGHSVMFEDMSITDVVEALRESPVAWLDAHAMREMVPLTRYPQCRELPDSLLQLLSAALDKDPTKRPQNAGEFASQLGKILHDDLGAIQPASLRLVAPGGGKPEDHPLIPGRRTMGSLPLCDFKIAGEGVLPMHAIVDWSGAPRPMQIRPYENANLVRNGERVAKVVNVEEGDVFAIGRVEFTLSAPET